jgi:glutamyl-tRNA synthetase
MKTKIRVRFAPSPTGFLHIGSLRTALYNYLFAKKNKGNFILRIEDTDKTRYVERGIENIIKTLTSCGLFYDEGPYLANPQLLDNYSPANSKLEISKSSIWEKGKYGPYIQSKRLNIYKEYAEELVKKKKAYYCFCSPQRLESLRQEQIAKNKPPMYDGHCRNIKITPSKIRKTPYVIRLKVPRQGITKFQDIIHGEIIFKNKFIDDQILLKSDGYPTYHLANVVDDHLMKITHVIRGEEWLPSTPKHILLYKAFGWQPPKFAHLPLLLNADHSKLSKRQGDVAVEDYLKKGYLPEALINFVALLGWNPKSDKELYTVEELINEFELNKINKTGTIVNFEKLDWMNGYYIRKKPIDELVRLCLPYLKEAGLIEKVSSDDKKFIIVQTKEEIDFEWLKKIIALEQERMKKLSEIPSLTEFFFVNQPVYEPEILKWKKMAGPDILRRLENLIALLKNIPEPWEAATLEKNIKQLIEKEKLGIGETLWPMRVALSGRQISPPPFDIAAILGKEKTLKRLAFALEMAKKIK